MRALILPFAIWVGALQVMLPNPGNAELYSAAGALASITVLVYRLGVWRQEMVNTKHNVGAEVARHREESAQQFARLEHRFSAVERFIEAATEHRVGVERWQGHVDTTLEAIDDSLIQLGNSRPRNRGTRKGVA